MKGNQGCQANRRGWTDRWTNEDEDDGRWVVHDLDAL